MEPIVTSRVIIAVAILLCVFQLLWFGSKCIHQIDYDGMAYTGVARHLAEGQFHASINAFRSPLLSWIIALGSWLDADPIQVGKLINISCYFFFAVFVYLFAL